MAPVRDRHHCKCVLLCVHHCVCISWSKINNRDSDSVGENMLRGSVLCPKQAVKPFNCMRRAEEVEW